jgi:putative ABC transport system ATP-binding protein
MDAAPEPVIMAARSGEAEALIDEDYDLGAIEDLGGTEPSPLPDAREDYIQFNNVRKIYQMGEVEIEALAGVDFTIKKGELVIITGASGAGKSTILNILGGMDSLTSGTIVVDDENISRYSRNQLITYRRYDVGFVFQFYNLVQNLTAIENVELAAQVSKKPLDIHQVMADVGLENRKNNFPSQLSGGEQQRVAIARALAKNPKLLLCDEPTGALDYVTSKQILKLLQDTCRRTGMTVIIISHNLALTAIGDRVIKVRSGRVDSTVINETAADVERIDW